MIVSPLKVNGTRADALADELARAGYYDIPHGDAYEGPDPSGDPPPEAAAPLIKTYTLGEMLQTFPQMREPVIHGLLRVGETANIIASPKTGKSWLAAGLAFAVATGRDWLGYNTVAGDVLLVDNELHPETLTSRLRRVAEANAIDLADVVDRITILPLRGRLQNLLSLGEYFRAQIPGRFRLVVIDAFYRSLPVGHDENDNAAVAGLYNLIDEYADNLRGSFVLIHHSSKGDQSQKRVTDVGSGAGSQSRAADSHLILRAHAEADAVVLDAAVRSFAPISPRCLRWKFPVFVPAEDLDPAELQVTTRRKRKPEPTEKTHTEPAWEGSRFASTFGTAEPKTRAVMLDDARAAGLSERLSSQLLQAAIDRRLLFTQTATDDARKILIANVEFAAEKPKRKRGSRPKK